MMESAGATGSMHFGGAPVPPPADVFATIASYDDPDTPDTVRSLLAAPGASVRVHVVLQTDSDALDAACRLAGAEVMRVSLEDTPGGACWPRAVGQAFHRGEPFWFQCDSHMRLRPGWASEMMRQLALLSGNSVLTSYVMAGDDTDFDGHEWKQDRGAAYVTDVSSTALLETPDLWQCRPKSWAGAWFNGMPAPARFFSGHFAFASSRFIEEVPYDPRLYFSGEEPSMAARAWTSGWNLYHPCSTVAVHRYGREGRRLHWDVDQKWWLYDDRSKARCAALWDERLQGVHGTGRLRSMQGFFDFAGIDRDAGTILTDTEWRARVPLRALDQTTSG